MRLTQKTISATKRSQTNKSYLDVILSKSHKNLVKVLGNNTSKFYAIVHRNIKDDDPSIIIEKFIEIYNMFVKKQYQSQHKYDKQLYHAIKSYQKQIKVVWGNSLDFLKKMPNESIQLMVTSPPYYNAREYSTWNDINDYLHDMEQIILESFRVLDNNHVFVFNVGDIFDNDNLHVRSVWGKRRLPLGAYFVNIFEKCGFTFVDDFMWDKGEVQSQRHKNGSKPYPFYQYPVNCYEHIMIFHKHRLDKTPYPCPVCGCLNVNGNSQSEINIQSWECKNLDCFMRSPHNRGKRFSSKTNLIQNPNRQTQNRIDHDLVQKWRRDIIKFNPVYKINSNGENKLGHTAPFPKDIPEMAINFFSYKGDNVLDPFAGSFTTSIVANQLERNGIGVELRKDLFGNSITQNIKRHGIKYKTIRV